MPARILLFVAGVLVGVGIMFAFHPRERSLSPPAPPAASGPSSELAEATERAERLQTEILALARENARLKETGAKATPPQAATVAKTNAASPWAAFFGGGSDTNRAEAMQKVMKAAVKQQVESQVTGLKVRLHLTDEQEQAVRAALEKQFGAGMELAGKMAEGKLTKEETEQVTKAADVKTTLKQILTPEQYTEYERYEIEQRQSYAQLMANNELAQVQPMLQLTQDQQDQVFEILYQHAEELMTPKTNLTPNAMAAGMQRWGEQQQSKKEALRGVLSDEQFQSYEKFLKTQEEMIKAFMPSTGATNQYIHEQVITVP